MHAIPLPDNSANIIDTLNKAKDQVDELDGVLVIALSKDGAPRLWGSALNGMEQAYMLAFANAWFHGEFDPQRIPPPSAS